MVVIGASTTVIVDRYWAAQLKQAKLRKLIDVGLNEILILWCSYETVLVSPGRWRASWQEWRPPTTAMTQRATIGLILEWVPVFVFVSLACLWGECLYLYLCHLADLGVSICICICICFTGLPLEWVFVFVFMSFDWSWSEYLYFELVIASLVGKHLSFVLRKYSCKDYRTPTELYALGAWIYAAIQHSRMGCLGSSAQSGDACGGGWSSPWGPCRRRSNWFGAAVYRLSCCHQSGWVPML